MRALSINYKQYYDLLGDLADDETENAETRNKVQSLADKLATLEFAFMCELWERILKKFHRTSLLLQSPDLDLKAPCALFKTLQDFMENLRDKFEDVESCARNKMDDVAQTYQSENRRTKRRRAFPDESTSSDMTFSGSRQMKVEAFLPVVNQICASLTQRCSAYKRICEEFSFLLEMAGNDKENILAGAKQSTDKYKDIFDQECTDEFEEFFDFTSKMQCENKCTNSCKHFNKEYCPDDHCKEICKKSPTELLIYLKKHSLISSLFPNVTIALRLF